MATTSRTVSEYYIDSENTIDCFIHIKDSYDLDKSAVYPSP